MKVLSVFGTRPEAIKMAPVVKALASDPFFEARVCVTAQHRQMLDQVLELFDIQPDFDLNLMKADQSLGEITSNALNGIWNIFSQWRPNMVLVHGDTTTTFAAGLSAYYAKIPVGHVEAGLRTENKLSPWPEEMNRRLMGDIADMHFAPTTRAKANLLREGVAEENIYVTGNTVIDALLNVVQLFERDEPLADRIARGFPFLESAKKMILVTGHRRENFGDGLERICCALVRIAKRDDVQIVYPLHLNQKAQEPVRHILSGRDNVFILEPQSYLSFVHLMRRSTLILTDSGGIQEEAPLLKKPVLVMRNATERMESLQTGTTKLVGTDEENIVRHVEAVLDDADSHAAMTWPNTLYGDGKAAQRIVNILKTFPGGA